VLVVGLVWMATWAAFMALLVTIIGMIDPRVIGEGEGPLDVMIIVGGTGAAAGLVFGLLLLVAEHRSALADIRSFAPWRGELPPALRCGCSALRRRSSPISSYWERWPPW
jgi:hypothetical protein